VSPRTGCLGSTRRAKPRRKVNKSFTFLLW